MRKRAWRKKYQLPPGYVQPELFQEEVKERTSFFGVFFKFLGIIALFGLLAAYLTQHIYSMDLGHKIAALEKQLDVIHRDNERLRLEYAQSENLAFVEQVALKKLGMVRPRKVIYLKGVQMANPPRLSFVINSP